jgi:hypothetical protein
MEARQAPRRAVLGFLTPLSESQRRALTIIVLLLLAVASGLFMWEWTRFFRSLRNWPRGVPLLTLIMLTGGALLARLRFARLSALPASMQLLVFTCIPSGFRFALFSHNILRGYHVGALTTSGTRIAHGWWSGRPHSDRRSIPYLKALVVLLVGAAVFFPQGATTLTELYITRDLAAAAAPFSWAVFGMAAALIAGSLPKDGGRYHVLAAMAVAGFYAVVIGQLPVALMATSFLVPAFTVALMVWVCPIDTSGVERDAVEEEGLLLAGTCLLALQVALGGLQIGQVDFAFTDPVASVLSGQAQYLVVSLLTIPKYTSAIIVLLAWYGFFRGRQQAAAATGWLLFFLNVKLCALLLQIATASLERTEKLYELAIGDFIFVYALMACVAIFSLAGGAIHAARQALLLSRPGSAEPLPVDVRTSPGTTA